MSAARVFAWPTEPVVYFVQGGTGGPIKIGVARDLRTRLGGLQTSASAPLNVLGYIPGDAATERQLHQRFAHLRQHGEWHRDEPELLSFIKEKATPLERQSADSTYAPSTIGDLRRAVAAYRARTGAMQKDIAREAGVTEEVLSRLLAAGRPDDEGPVQHDPKLSTVNRVGAVVGLRVRLGSADPDPIAAALADAVEALQRAEDAAVAAKGERAATVRLLAEEAAELLAEVKGGAS